MSEKITISKFGEVDKELCDYIGDGVYTFYDGFNIWLFANDILNPTDAICLEPNTLENLNMFNRRMHRKEIV